MVRLNKIYTRTGDDGTTGLVDGSRIAKHALRMQAIGDVDEANSLIGLAIVPLQAVEGDTYAGLLRRVQNELFDLGADLATPGEDFTPSDMALRITAAQVERLEAEIDEMNIGLPPLRSFILPGGDQGSALLHLARAVVRRAERSAVAAAGEQGINPQALAYLNRLSDYLFVMARTVSARNGGDILWVPGASR